MNVAGWCQPDADVIFFYFFRTGFADFFYQFFIPGACKKRCTWPCGCLYSCPWADTKTGRSVCCHDVRYPVFRDISHSKGICTSCIWLTAKKIDAFIQCQEIHKFIQRHLAVCHIFKTDSFRFNKIKEIDSFFHSSVRAWKSDCVFILSWKSLFFHIFTLWKFLVGTVCEHTFRQMIRSCFFA